MLWVADNNGGGAFEKQDEIIWDCSVLGDGASPSPQCSQPYCGPSCSQPYCGSQYPCGKFQLITGLPCCPNPDYVSKDGWADWWEEQEYATPVPKTKLPIVLLDTLGENPSCGDKVDTKVFASTIDGLAQEFSSESTRSRLAGQSSRGYKKKQFNIYFDEAQAMLDLPAQEDYRLYAPYEDKSALKNWLVFTADRCNGQWSPRTRFVRAHLVAEDEEGKVGPRDMGLYALTEKIKRDKNKVNIASKKCDTAPDCGYIMEVDRYGTQADDGTLLQVNGCVKVPAEITYPGSPTSDQRHFLQGYINKMCDNAYTDKLFDYIDAESFYNQFVYTQLSMNVDGYISSEYFHKDQGGKIKAGPQWDFNLAFGSNYEKDQVIQITGRNPEHPDFGWMRDGDNDNSGLKTLSSLHQTFGWSAFVKNPSFVDGLICHYKNLRKFVMTDDHMMSILDKGHAFLKLEGAADNFLPTIDEHVAKLKDWTKARLAWMDAHIENYKIGLSGTCPDDYSPPSEAELSARCQMPDL